MSCRLIHIGGNKPPQHEKEDESIHQEYADTNENGLQQMPISMFGKVNR